MLYINQELVNTNNKSGNYEHSKFVEDYDKAIRNALDYYGDFLVVETKVRPHSDKKTGLPRFPGPRGLVLTSTVNGQTTDGTGLYELRYSPVILQTNDSGNLVHENPNLLIHRGTHSIDIKRNPDLAYYVLKSGKVGITPAEGKKFHIYDVKATDKKSADDKRAQGATMNLIYTALSEPNLRILAKSWGIDSVDALDIDSVREALYDKLLAAEEEKKRNPNSKVRGFKEFSTSAEVKEVDKLTAMCKDAEGAGKLIYDGEDRTWVLDYQDGGKRHTLKELAGDEFGDPLGSLVGYLSINEDALRKVKNIIGQALPPKEEVVNPKPDVPRMDMPKYTAEMVLKEGKVPVLKKILRELDPDITLPRTTKGDEVKKIILGILAKETTMQETEG